MAKKIRRIAALPKIKESAHEIWLAGLGAFALAGEEGGRLFRSLVKKGQGMEKVNKTRIEKLAHRVDGLKGDARNAVARVRTPIEAGMADAMDRRGVRPGKGIATRTKRGGELTRVVAKARNKGARRARTARGSTTPAA